MTSVTIHTNTCVAAAIEVRELVVDENTAHPRAFLHCTIDEVRLFLSYESAAVLVAQLIERLGQHHAAEPPA
jgi:hypothetical protein